MKVLAEDIRQTVIESAEIIRSISLMEFDNKPSPTKWSKKEILGHLVDSAQNNLQRFVRAQYENIPRIIYHQDEWVKLQHYKDYEREELIQLWVSLNLHLCRTLSAMDPANYEKQCDTGKPGTELHTLSFLADDYLQHTRHHLAQITGE
ncbi:MAG TPA: DinB family protein [Cyclobacteriaceae bacterium]|nr:DinB family protein [Cyclobacteriaceae bacterium]